MFTFISQLLLMLSTREDSEGFLRWTIEPPAIKQEVKTPYRLTSYYTNDSTGSGLCTGSGKCTKDFEVNEQGWYTYENKVVLAAATTVCLSATRCACGNWNTRQSDITYYSYFQELEIEIDEIRYGAVVLDSCGGCMLLKDADGGFGRMDIFVHGKENRLDRGYLGNNPAYIIGVE